MTKPAWKVTVRVYIHTISYYIELLHALHRASGSGPLRTNYMRCHGGPETRQGVMTCTTPSAKAMEVSSMVAGNVGSLLVKMLQNAEACSRVERRVFHVARDTSPVLTSPVGTSSDCARGPHLDTGWLCLM